MRPNHSAAGPLFDDNASQGSLAGHSGLLQTHPLIEITKGAEAAKYLWAAGIPVLGRGTQHWSAWSDRQGCRGALGRGHSRCGHHDGHLHQILWCCRRLHRIQQVNPPKLLALSHMLSLLLVVDIMARRRDLIQSALLLQIMGLRRHILCSTDDGLFNAACRAVVDYVRVHGPANLSATAMSPPIAEQIMAALDLIQGKDGSSRGAEKLQTLQQNAIYFREGLQRMGCIVLGTGASPIVVSPGLHAPIVIFLLVHAALGS